MELNGCRRFSVSRLQRPTPRDVSHFGCAAEKTPLRQTVLRLSELNGRFRFSVSRLRRPSSSGHKPAQLRDQDRLTGPSYAFQSLTGAVAFLYYCIFEIGRAHV